MMDFKIFSLETVDGIANSVDPDKTIPSGATESLFSYAFYGKESDG